MCRMAVSWECVSVWRSVCTCVCTCVSVCKRVCSPSPLFVSPCGSWAPRTDTGCFLCELLPCPERVCPATCGAWSCPRVSQPGGRRRSASLSSHHSASRCLPREHACSSQQKPQPHTEHGARWALSLHGRANWKSDPAGHGVDAHPPRVHRCLLQGRTCPSTPTCTADTCRRHLPPSREMTDTQPLGCPRLFPTLPERQPLRANKQAQELAASPADPSESLGTYW